MTRAEHETTYALIFAIYSIPPYIYFLRIGPGLSIRSSTMHELLLVDTDVEVPLLVPQLSFSLPDKPLFFKKTLVIVLASYLFLPLMGLHDDGEITSLAYATILVSLHLFFLLIYFYRVRYKDLEADSSSRTFRVLGLVFCVILLLLVAGNLDNDLKMLAVELIALCAVHTVILAFLMVKVEKIEAPIQQRIWLTKLKTIASAGSLLAIFFINTQPLIGSGISLTLVFFSIGCDASQFSKGETPTFPKFLDSSLLCIWISLFAAFSLVPLPDQGNLRKFGPASIPLVLFTMGQLSVCCINGGFVFQLAVETVERRLWDVNSPKYDQKNHKSFLFVCRFITHYWSVVFITMFAGGFFNAYTNTCVVAPEMNMSHADTTINWVFGIMWSPAVIFIALKFQRSLIDYLVKKTKTSS